MASEVHSLGGSDAAMPVSATEEFAEAALHSEVSLEAASDDSPEQSRPSGTSRESVTAEIPQAESEDFERLEANREPVPFADSIGAIRGFTAVLALYIILAALAFGGFLLWRRLH